MSHVFDDIHGWELRGYGSLYAGISEPFLLQSFIVAISVKRKQFEIALSVEKHLEYAGIRF